MTTVVAQTEHTTAYFTPGKSQFLVVSFRGMNTDTRHLYWGQPQMEELEINCLGIAPTKPNWYPREEMVAVSKIISPWLNRFDRRLGYGFSMGGYGALAHADILGLTDILAFGPQWSIDPSKVASFDARYHEHFAPENEGMEIQLKGGLNTFLVYDPLNREDAEHVRRIDPRSACKHIKVFGGSHKTVTFVVGAERMKAAIDAVLAHDYAHLSRSIRSWKKAHPRYIENVQYRLQARAKRKLVANHKAVAIAAEEPRAHHVPEKRAFLSLLRKWLSR